MCFQTCENQQKQTSMSEKRKKHSILVIWCSEMCDTINKQTHEEIVQNQLESKATELFCSSSHKRSSSERWNKPRVYLFFITVIPFGRPEILVEHVPIYLPVRTACLMAVTAWGTLKASPSLQSELVLRAESRALLNDTAIEIWRAPEKCTLLRR